jgi:hypothetical protein
MSDYDSLRHSKWDVSNTLIYRKNIGEKLAFL